MQKILWEQPHSSAQKHVPAKLTLCIGLPVMLKHNDATECCMTNGAEATVAGWQSILEPDHQMVLDTLFVKLKNPPKCIKLDGLPENVVPLTRHSTSIMCSLPNDDEISISREQVLVLPNFAMKDYASQDRTRPDNVVDLNSCKTHLSYYTCLSRSASAAGTIIVQGFDPRVITGGASGYLRQEFRELEILDEITNLRYQNDLPSAVIGNTRNSLISGFQKWKGSDFVPSNVHAAIQWGKFDSLVVTESNNILWQIIDKKGKAKNIKETHNSHNGFVPAKGTSIVQVPAAASPQKHKPDETSNLPVIPKSKKIRIDEGNVLTSTSDPLGLLWDADNYSCVYDALFTILLSIYFYKPRVWKERFRNLNRTMGVLAKRFQCAVLLETSTLETARNKVRQI